MPAKTIPIFLLLFLFSACGAPATELPPPAPAATNPPTAQPEAVAPTTESDLEPEAQALEATSQPELTYRGDALIATDPTLLNFESGRPQLVEFFRFTWGTCRSMAPMVHGLEVEYYGKIDFHYLDADAPETRDWQRELGFRYQPEFYLLDGSGNVVKKWIGYVNADSFRAEFNSLLGQ